MPFLMPNREFMLSLALVLSWVYIAWILWLNVRLTIQMKILLFRSQVGRDPTAEELRKLLRP